MGFQSVHGGDGPLVTHLDGEAQPLVALLLEQGLLVDATMFFIIQIIRA